MSKLNKSSHVHALKITIKKIFIVSQKNVSGEFKSCQILSSNIFKDSICGWVYIW